MSEEISLFSRPHFLRELNSFGYWITEYGIGSMEIILEIEIKQKPIHGKWIAESFGLIFGSSLRRFSRPHANPQDAVNNDNHCMGVKQQQDSFHSAHRLHIKRH